MAINTDAVQRLYVAYFNRPSDPIGQAYWESKLPATAATQAQLTTLAAGFSGSAEYAALYAGQSNAQIVNNLYLNLFGRPAETAGLTSWALALTNGTQTFASIALQLTYSAQGTDATAIANKLSAANSFTNSLVTSAQITGYSGTAAAASARTWLATVTDVASTLTSATAAATLSAAVTAATAAGASTGTTFTLTTGVDTLTGTANNDTFTGDDTGSVTVSAADSINGGGGVDTFKHYLASAATTVLNPTLTNVANLYINGGAIVTADLSGLTGVTSVSIDNLGGAATYTLAGTESLTVLNDNGATVRNVTAIYGATDAATNITLSGVGKTGSAATLDVQGAKLATLNLTATGTTNNVVLTNSTNTALATLNIAGDKAVTVAESLAGLKTINASTATGAVTADVSGATLATTFAFTGGTANDNVKIGAGQLVKTMTLNGGAGTDTLTIGDASITSGTTALNAGINATTNFEILAFNATAATAADLSQITAFTQFDLAGATSTAGVAGTAATAGGAGNGGNSSGVAVALTGEANTQTFIVDASISSNGGAAGTTTGTATGNTGGNGSTAVSINPLVDNGSNAATLTLNGVTLNSFGGAGGAGLGINQNGGAGGNGAITVDASSFETVNIVSNANAAGTTTANVFNAAGGAAGAATGIGTAGAVGTTAAGLAVGTNATVTISGAADFNSGLISGANVVVNAGSLTGKLTMATGSGNDTITGGSNVNTITLNGGVDSVDLTKSVAKADQVIVGAVSGLDATASKFISVSGFTNALTTGDKLDVVGTGVVTADASNQSTGISNLTASFNKGFITFSGSAASTATLSQLVTGAFTAMNDTTGNREAAFQFGSDTYVIENIGTTAAYAAGTDLVVKLVGVSGIAGLSATASDVNTIFAV